MNDGSMASLNGAGISTVCGGYNSVPLLVRESLCVVTVLLTVVGGDTPCLDSVCTAVACTACCLCGKQRAVPACIAVKPAHHSNVHHLVHISGLVQLEMCLHMLTRTVLLCMHMRTHKPQLLLVVTVQQLRMMLKEVAKGCPCSFATPAICDQVRGNTSRRGVHATAAAVCLQQQLLVAATATCVGLWIATMPCDHICTCPSTSQQQPSSAG